MFAPQIQERLFRPRLIPDIIDDFLRCVPASHKKLQEVIKRNSNTQLLKIYLITAHVEHIHISQLLNIAENLL